VIPPSIIGNLIVFLALLGIMTVLAFAKIAKGRNADRWLGNLTYPLYLYHEDVLVAVLTFTVGYSYGMFAAGILFSLMAAIVLMALVDPAITRYRDRVRGRSLLRAARSREPRSNMVSRHPLPVG
jgi:peptidoglycan/LPS O-acetylase OafA/YrhL